MVYCRVDSGSSNRIRLALDISRIRQEGLRWADAYRFPLDTEYERYGLITTIEFSFTY